MTRPHLSTSIIGIFLLSLIYWIYLACNTQMQISGDAIGYQDLGRLLQNHGWRAYFQTGPNREPLYPLLVMISMHLEAMSGIAYAKIMAFLGILLLCGTQILIYIILKELRVRTSICAVTLAYFAISPAINNAAFSLYSEIAALPLILLLLLGHMKACQSIRTGTAKDAVYAGACLGLIFCAVTFVKAIFEFIFLIFALFYLLAWIAYFLKGKKSMAVNGLLVLFTFAACYQVPVIAYKHLNKEYNGHYVLTNRGSWALYASSARRAEKLTPERLLGALAYIPGKGFCEDSLGHDKCYFWGIENLDSIGLTKFHEVSSQIPPSMVDQRMMGLSKEKVMQNPAQFLLLMGFDGLKMFFWESTQIGFVTYPPWLQQLYNNHLLKNTWRAIAALLCLAGSIFLMLTIIAGNRCLNLVLIFTLLVSFIGFYALFDTIPRFALPIAPLELITIALLAEALRSQSADFQRKMPLK